MNRVIKFRGKRTDDGKWLYGDLIQDSDNKKGIWPIVSTNSNGIDEVHADTVGQFTGLRDLNGNEIYEGDIAKFDDSPYCAYATPYMGEVVMRQGTWCIKHQTIFGDVYPRLFRDDFADHKTEILGNIYDNPELLKQ